MKYKTDLSIEMDKKIYESCSCISNTVMKKLQGLVGSSNGNVYEIYDVFIVDQEVTNVCIFDR